MNKISEIWERTIGIEGVDTGYPKFEKELEDFIRTAGEGAVRGFSAVVKVWLSEAIGSDTPVTHLKGMANLMDTNVETFLESLKGWTFEKVYRTTDDRRKIDLNNLTNPKGDTE